LKQAKGKLAERLDMDQAFNLLRDLARAHTRPAGAPDAPSMAPYFRLPPHQPRRPSRSRRRPPLGTL